jgi:hypothetical protein
MDLYYTIYPDKNLVVASHRGTFEVREYIEHILCFMEDPLYQKNLDGVIDLSGISVEIMPSDMQVLFDFLTTHEKTPSGRWACITTTPLATAYTMIYQRAAIQHDSFGIFSTWEATERFMGCEIPRPDFLPC